MTQGLSISKPPQLLGKLKEEGGEEMEMGKLEKAGMPLVRASGTRAMLLLGAGVRCLRLFKSKRGEVESLWLDPPRKADFADDGRGLTW